MRTPFTLGVASGYPTTNGVVLWTRLAPEPLAEDGGMGKEPVPVEWEVSEDEGFKRIVRSGAVMATADEAHSVHIELTGLKPAQDYWYRFTALSVRSITARTRTAPASDSAQAIRLAFASCQQYEQGYYSAYRDMATQSLDLVIHLGDYIYESSWGQKHVRHHTTKFAPTTLSDFRVRYAQYKSDQDLQAAHAASPWLVTWDDHEVANDYTNDVSPTSSDASQFLAIRAAAYRAWWEHMPAPSSMRPNGANAHIYGSWQFGSMLNVLLVDGRQYRDHQVCLFSRNASRMVDCADRSDSARSMLGPAQESWLEQQIATTRARWNVLAQPTLMASVDRRTEGLESVFWMDGWDGYAATRDRILAVIEKHRPSNPLVISGDVHAFFAADLRRAPDAPILATEFVGGAITSQGTSEANMRRLLAQNPDLRYGHAAHRGYAILQLLDDSAQVEFRFVDNEKVNGSSVGTLARFVVQDGFPGVRRV